MLRWIFILFVITAAETLFWFFSAPGGSPLMAQASFAAVTGLFLTASTRARLRARRVSGKEIKAALPAPAGIS